MSSNTSKISVTKNGKHLYYIKLVDGKPIPAKEEFTIEILVAGWGWCRYKDKKDRDENCVYCKNCIWKMRGDKTAYDEDGVYCETEDEDACDSCGTTCLDHKSNKGRGSESPCKECGENRCNYCPCECGENKCPCECGENRGSCKWGEDIYK